MHPYASKAFRLARLSQHGFSAIELLAVLILIAILATIAYPSYIDSVRKGRRAEGRAALMKLMLQQERFHMTHNRYIEFSAAATDSEAQTFQWFSGDSPAASSYEIMAAACKDEDIRDCVLLVAKPGTSRVNPNHQDASCGDLGLTSEGKKSARLSTCW